MLLTLDILCVTFFILGDGIGQYNLIQTDWEMAFIQEP